MTRFLLVRHGQTHWNVDRKIQGLTDIELNSEGLLQAEKLAQRLRTESIHHIYSSHLLRAKRTAEIVAAHHPQAGFEILEDLAEFGMGVVEGMIVEHAHAQYTPHFWDDDVMRLKLGMELRSTYLEKFQRHLSGWLERHQDQTVLMASHGGKLMTLLNAFTLSEAERLQMKEKHLTNCSLTVVEVNSDSHKLVMYSADEHLLE